MQWMDGWDRSIYICIKILFRRKNSINYLSPVSITLSLMHTSTWLHKFGGYVLWKHKMNFNGSHSEIQSELEVNTHFNNICRKYHQVMLDQLWKDLEMEMIKAYCPWDNISSLQYFDVNFHSMDVISMILIRIPIKQLNIS